METPSSFPKQCPRSFPFRAGKRNAILTMYRVVHRNGYKEFKVQIIRDGKRKFAAFGQYPPAQRYANEELALRAKNSGDDLVLKQDEKSDYCRAIDLLRPLAVSLEAAARVVVEATEALEGTQISILEAARAYAKRHPAKMPEKLVLDVVKEFVESKRAGKRSVRYIEDLKYRLGYPQDGPKKRKRGFAEAFPMNISRIDRGQLQAFLDGLKLSGRSYNNFRAALISLFDFAKKRKYLPSDWNEFDGIDTINDNGGAIEIFTTDEMAALLSAADEQLVPFLAIGGFAGLRSAEIDRLDWQDVRFETGHIVVEKNKAKTASRRVVPIPANLKEWLQPYAKTRGKVWPHSHAYLYEVLNATATAAKVQWKQNALRHSFISYRVAETQDVNKVALEAGNSPAMIFSNYRELVTPQDASRWFALKRTNATNLIGLKAA